MAFTVESIDVFSCNKNVNFVILNADIHIYTQAFRLRSTPGSANYLFSLISAPLNKRKRVRKFNKHYLYSKTNSFNQYYFIYNLNLCL